MCAKTAEKHESTWTRKGAGTLEKRGCFDRGYLPHFDEPGLVQMLTFRLGDSMPAGLIGEWKEQLGLLGCAPLHRAAEVELRRRVERYLDRGRGECLLGDPRAALIVQSAFLHFDGERYRLLAWVVMPNHVHVLIEVFAEHPISSVTHSWKSYTAKRLNELFGRTGRVWQPETYDRFIRGREHYRRSVRYIHGNPDKAGLVARSEDWRFSSAWKGWGGGEGWRAGEALVFPADEHVL